MKPMKQLVLDIHQDAPPDFDNFVTGANAELVAALRNSVQGHTHLYLWGAHMSGRSHLLGAAVACSRNAGREACLLDAGSVGSALPDTPAMLLAIDDVDQLDDAAQVALFNAFNRARTLRQTLLLSGPCPPLELRLREDLRTRIGQCLIYEVQPLDDEARTRILIMLANRRGLQLGEDVIGFVLRHGRRDLPSLVALIDALDRASLEHKRPITLPLLRSLMQTGLTL